MDVGSNDFNFQKKNISIKLNAIENLRAELMLYI